MISYLQFLDFFPTASASQYETTIECMALGAIVTPLRAAAFLSTIPSLRNVWDHAAKWHLHDLNHAADNGNRTAIAKAFRQKDDAGVMLRRLHHYCRVLRDWPQ